jgi:exopolysaccharide production protein ExoQ
VFSRAFERLFVVALLLSSMGAVDTLTRPQMQETGVALLSDDKEPLSAVIVQVGIYSWGMVLVSVRWRRVLGAVRTVWPLVAFSALAPVSTLWSVQPILTLKRSALLMMMTMFGLYMGERYSMEEFARLLAHTLCITMVAVIIIHFVAPAIVIDQRFDYADAAHRGGWRGLSPHKNVFGEYMALAFALLLLVRFRRFRWLRYGFLVSAAVLLVLARSSNAIACALLIIAAMPLWSLSLHKGKRLLLAYTFVAIAFVLGFCMIFGTTSAGTDFLFKMLGRDSTLTGRTELWSMVLPAIMKHPLLGYGYGAFWDNLKGETLGLWTGAGFLARGAHNGFLDLGLSYGVLGVPLVVYLFVHYFRIAIDYCRTDSGCVALLPVTYLSLFVLHNMNESDLMQSWRSLPFLMFATIITLLATNRRKHGQVVIRRIPIDRSSTVVTAHLYPKQQTPR